ncbi:D-alanine--D-alanine ligase family protein [Thiovibrio frasassiensis]|jgi:D-alanine-D-alanine ligase|uniref:D-alanine--D-alanine ligase n=1 Tax=Thiovibrio frasassiensis TaxID=2984131 RepID=A0A9X4MGC5_9BACT|nr:D-alanine--D-alanine ligase [Thiovibrio frasassiensis]MDG4475740.1 D-alanine--D-alanine ligase [Thiovibrio frasassiensis]
MEKKIRLALIAGGKSGEREVSLAGAKEVEKALSREKYEVRRYDPATDLARLAADAGTIEMAFILLHGPLGEDGTMQGFLDLLGVPYQGAGVLGSALAMDKNLAKILYKQAGLTVADWEMAQPEDQTNPRRLLACLSLPLVIKPIRQGSSLGMSLAKSEAELSEGLIKAFTYDSEVMVEEYVRGREITGGVLGNKELTALPIVEIIPGEGYAFFDYQAKYQPGASREVCPAELAPEVTAKAQAIALTAHRALQLKGYSRTDMIVAGDSIYVLETNTIPGMTPTSLLPQAAAAHGLPFPALLDRLIELALAER